jgi:hypothetical protein
MSPRVGVVTGGYWLGLTAASILLAAACTSWRDETKGTAAIPTTATSSTGGGGGGSCLGCNDFLIQSSTCEPSACPAIEDVCEGAARDAVDALMGCAMCGACAGACVVECGAGGSGGSPAMSDGCEQCMMGAIMGACASEYGTCSQV